MLRAGVADHGPPAPASSPCVDEVHGFKYFDDRDLLGFVDGTENPTGAAAAAAVTVGDEDPDFAGGSYVIVQKYLHDLDAWNAMSVEEQERAIGRRKLSNVELSDADKPTNSHVALNTIVDPDGTERQILRDNMAFGAVGRREFGTYFIGYASSPSVIEQMLRNMFVGDPPGNHDRILDFSTAHDRQPVLRADRRLPRRPAAGAGADGGAPVPIARLRRPWRRPRAHWASAGCASAGDGAACRCGRGARTQSHSPSGSAAVDAPATLGVRIRRGRMPDE